MNLDYLKDIEIDPDALDVEWVNQSKLSLKYGKNWAEASETVQRKEESLKLVRAELIEEITSNSDHYFEEGVKPTKDNVESKLIQMEDYQEAVDEVLKAKTALNYALIAKNEITGTRKSALENLVKLHALSYFAGPIMPRNLGQEVRQAEEKKNKSESSISRKLNRRKLK